MEPAAQARDLAAAYLRRLTAVGAGEAPRPASVEAQTSAEAQDLDEQCAKAFSQQSPAELYTQLTPVLCDKHAHDAMQFLLESGVLLKVLPELEATVAFSQEGGRRHKDVWDHTKIVVRQAVPRPEVRWAAALHDIGKVPTRRFTDKGRVTFHGHAEVGVRMFRHGPAKRIKFPEPLRTRVEDLIRFHLRPGQYERGWSDAAVRRFAKEMGPALRDVLDLSRADITSKRPGKRASCLRSISELAGRITALAEADAVPKALPPGLGNLLMSELGLPPGKHLGDLRKKLLALCEAGELEGGRDASYYIEAVRTRALAKGLEIRVPKNLKQASPSE